MPLNTVWSPGDKDMKFFRDVSSKWTNVFPAKEKRWEPGSTTECALVQLPALELNIFEWSRHVQWWLKLSTPLPADLHSSSSPAIPSPFLRLDFGLFPCLEPMLVSEDCHDKVPQIRWLYQQKCIVLGFGLEAWGHGVLRVCSFWGQGRKHILRHSLVVWLVVDSCLLPVSLWSLPLCLSPSVSPLII